MATVLPSTMGCVAAGGGDFYLGQGGLALPATTACRRAVLEGKDGPLGQAGDGCGTRAVGGRERWG